MPKRFDAVEKLFFGGPTVPEGDGKCLPRGQRTLIALLIASFSQAKFRAHGKGSFSTASFLKGTSDRIENMEVRFASPTVAVGTVTSIMSAFTMPDGVKHGAERHIRTFELVKRGDRCLIMQDLNTTILEAAQ